MTSNQEIKAELEEIERQIKVLDWDKQHNQINPSMAAKLDKLKERKQELEKQLHGEVMKRPETEPVVKDKLDEQADEILKNLEANQDDLEE